MTSSSNTRIIYLSFTDYFLGKNLSDISFDLRVYKSTDLTLFIVSCWNKVILRLAFVFHLWRGKKEHKVSKSFIESMYKLIWLQFCWYISPVPSVFIVMLFVKNNNSNLFTYFSPFKEIIFFATLCPNFFNFNSTESYSEYFQHRRFFIFFLVNYTMYPP